MNRRMVTLLTLFVLLSLLVFVPGSRSSASLQTGSPESATPAAIDEAVSELPADLDVRLLASSERTGLPSNGVHLQVDRIRLSPDEEFSGTENGFSLIAVEAGSVSLSMSATSSEVAAGASFSVESGKDYLISAVGAEDVVLIRVTLGGPTNSASPAASPVSGIVPQLLAAGNANRLVSRKGTLFLAQVTIPVGGATGEQIFSGPIAIAVDAGAVTIEQETGPDLTLDEGYGGIVQGFSHFNATNTGDESAVLIVAGLLAPVTGAASGPTPTLTATPTAGVDSSATAIASAESAAIEATTAALQNEIALAADARATVEAALVLAESSVANLSADLTVVSSNLVTAITTVEAQASAIAVTEATQTADAQTIASVIAANADRSRELASANQTVEALTEDVAAADAEVIAREAELAAVNATASAQADELGAAEGSATQQAGILSSVVAIVESQSNALDSANATASAQTAAIDAANATATAQAGQIAAADATASAQAAAIDSANANATAVTSSAAATEEAQTYAIASAQAEATLAASSFEATIVAAQTAAANAQSTLTAKSIEITAAEATIIALNTAQADAASLAVASLNPNYVDVTVRIDLNGVLNNDPKAIADAGLALDTALTPYKIGCRAGVVLTFGHGESIGQGTRLAAAVNAVIKEKYPTIFGGAAFDAFGNLNPTLGDVDIRIYFFSGCAAAE